MYDVTAIVGRGQGVGFTLAGVRVLEVSNDTDAYNMLAEEITNEQNGIILIDEAFSKNYPSKLQKQVDESTIPLVVAIPIITQWEYTYDRDEMLEHIIRRAIGYRINLFGGS